MVEITDYALNIRHFQPDTFRRLVTTTILRVLAPYVDRDRVTLDVGGNTGHMAYFFSEHSKHVHSYEAVELVYQRLKLLEQVRTNITVHNLAMSNFCGTATFYVDHKRLSNSSFLNLVDGPPVDVPVASIDSLNRDDVGFIKIDVEGTELDVIKGADETIGRCRPNMMVEIYKPYANDPLDAIFAYLMERDYNCYYYDHSKPEGLVPVPDVAAGVEAVETLHDIHDGDFLFVAR